MGLQLAALWLKARGGQDGLMEHFGGEHPYVLDYLMEEVLGSQDSPLRAFLLRTSILDRLCGPHCTPP